MFSLSEGKLISYILFCISKGRVCLYTRRKYAGYRRHNTTSTLHTAKWSA